MPAVDYLVIGHVTKDITPDGHTVGGTSTYAAQTATRLGLRAGVVTAAEESFAAELRSRFPEIPIRSRPSPQTTTFENIYTDLGRIQYLRAHAERIQAIDVPNEWRTARIAHLGPVAQEFNPNLRNLFEGSFVGLTPQGWMRRWDGEGRVSLALWERAREVMEKVNATVFSWEDVQGDERLVHLYSQASPVAVMTLGRRGAVVFERNHGQYFPSRKVNLVDSTGAGDVFAASFFIWLNESGDPYEAMRFATVAASFSVEGHGLQAIPDRKKVLSWLKAYPTFQR